MFGRAAIVVERHHCGVTVPLSAVLYGSGGQPIVQTVRSNQVVTKASKSGTLTINDGDMIVTRAGGGCA
jgi:hypothetical protein